MPWFLLGAALCVFAVSVWLGVWGIWFHWSIEGDGPGLMLVQLFGLIGGAAVLLMGLVVSGVLAVTGIASLVSDATGTRRVLLSERLREIEQE